MIRRILYPIPVTLPNLGGVRIREVVCYDGHPGDWYTQPEPPEVLDLIDPDGRKVDRTTAGPGWPELADLPTPAQTPNEDPT